MEKELILLNEYCEKGRAELEFVLRLENEGLIETEKKDDLYYIPLSQLGDLEMFSRLYYDLSINIEGIDVINNLLSRMKQLEQELKYFRRRFDIDPFFPEQDFIEEF